MELTGKDIGKKMDSPTRMEPLLPEDNKHVLEELATDLVDKASRLGGRIHPVLQESLGELVRAMNCYYSNLIEGHDTHPVDIDRAMKGDYANDPKSRNLQLEAKAHIDVQRLIDEGAAPSPVVSVEFLLWVHEQFCARLPEDLLWVTNPDTGERLEVVPGALRQSHVKVGRHIPPAPEDIDAFLRRFVEGYTSGHLSRLRKIIASGAAHHRFVWIHPFLDGNGRVSRLFSYAWLKELGVGSTLWSVARGLARNVDDYKAVLQAADEPRRGDLDGRGSLTMAGLEKFCAFFLKICVDQVTFMEGLFDAAELLNRMEIWVNEEIGAGRLLRGSWPLIREAVVAGEFSRGQAAALTGYRDRQARSVLSQLIAAGVLVSGTEKGPVRLGFPIAVVERWFPRLYPAIG
ncbi:Fic family protein [Ochrobactrum soli]|uniref:Fido domain-containing protein n=1 Tax=Ochrobactrum soli TaxID=2448455 RepID=A0A2P9HEF9_9HYPH|nr:Fic family protein [[Ochrobactrum] soli]SPL62478.1 hypothetical protein OHAE_5085 [[Ochrobactrum] soli]